MDFLNKSFRQLVDLFQSMTPGARVTTSLLLVAIVASLLYLFRFQPDRADEYLFGGTVMTQSEIVAMEAAFGKGGLSNFEIVGNRVRVPRLKKSSYLAALAEENALPESAESAWLDMFASESPFDGKATREHKARFAQEKQLGHIISRLGGIEIATVKIDEQQAAAFGGVKTRQALVAVKPLGSKTLDDEQVKTIRYTIASGAGVKPEFVTVTDMNGQVVYPGIGKEQGASEFQNIYATYQRQYANFYKQLILSRLSAYQGIKVEAHVELDKSLQNQTSSFKYDEKPTATQSTTLTKELSSTAGDKGGRPGAVPNGAIGNAPAQVAAAPASESTVNESREEQKSVVGATQTIQTTTPLSPVYVSASIGIPTSYYAKVWHMRNPAKPGEEPKVPPADQLKLIEQEEIKEIEEAVAWLLPRPATGENRFERVKVSSFDETPTIEVQEPTLSANAFDWLASNWQTLGLFGLALFGVIFLRGMVRSAQSTLPPAADKAEHVTQAAALEAEEQAVAAKEPNAEPAPNALKRKFQSSGRSLRDELTDLVREDPDAAANVLKLWISDAA